MNILCNARFWFGLGLVCWLGAILWDTLKKCVKEELKHGKCYYNH